MQTLTTFKNWNINFFSPSKSVDYPRVKLIIDKEEDNEILTTLE